MKFKDKVAFVTGAASGIGRATAVRLAAEGAQLYLVDIDEAGLAALSAKIAGQGGEIAVQRLDVADASACREAIDAVVARFGRLDVLCNIAGIAAANHLADVTDAVSYTHLTLPTI